MANTTNFNWETPDDTDLVKDGAAAIRTLGSAIDTSLVDLKGGTTGQVLSKATNTDMDFTWVTSDDANAIQNAIVDAKGDIVAASAADTPARLAVGTDNQRLVAASGETTGLKYVSDTQNTVIDAAGDLLYGTAADTLGRLAIGTAGQVLKVNSGATAPEWGTAGGASGLTKITSGSVSAVASFNLDNIFTATYQRYMVVLNVSASATANLNLRFRAAGSTTSSADYYGSGWSIDRGNTEFTSGQAAATSKTISTDATSFNLIVMYFTRVGNTSEKPAFMGTWTGGGMQRSGHFAGILDVAGTYDGIHLFVSANDVTGNYQVFGLEN